MSTGPVGNTKHINPTAPDTSKGIDKSKAAVDTARGRATENAGRQGATGNYSVDVSSEAREMAASRQKALDIARNTPDVREDRVAEIKAQIAAGTYKVDSGKIADGMLREAVKERLAELD